MRKNRFVVVQWMRPSLAQGLVPLASGAALIAVCAVWTVTHPPPVEWGPVSTNAAPLTAVWLGGGIAVGLALLGLLVDARGKRSQARAAATLPADAALDARASRPDVIVVALFTVFTAVSGFHPVAGGLTGGFLGAVGLFMMGSRLHVGRLERDSGRRLVSGPGGAAFTVPPDAQLRRVPSPPPLLRRLADRKRLRLWSQRAAAAVLALLGGAGIGFASLVLLGVAWHLVDRDQNTRPVVVAQVIELLALLLLIVSACLLFHRLLPRFSGEKVALGWLLVISVIQMMPITVYGRGHGPGPVGGRQAEDVARAIERLTPGRPQRTVAYEVVLVFDRADAVGRRLIQFAHDHPDAVEGAVRGVVRPRASVHFVTLEPGADPSADPFFGAFGGAPVQALQQVEPRRGPPATASIPAVLQALAEDPPLVPTESLIRRELLTRRAVVLALDRLPSRSELEATGSDWDAVRQAWGGPELVVEAPPGAGAVTDEWRRWLAEMGGRLQDPGTYRSQVSLVQRAVAGVAGRPADDVAQIAFDFRPVLLFDGEQRLAPLDVDRFLAERPAHKGCERNDDFAADECQPVRGAADLFAFGNDFDYLDLPGHRRFGADVAPDSTRGARQRIYYRASRARRELHLQYWWFLRFNRSPIDNELICLPGLSIQETTCFDHEGDWEGVTVTLRREGDAYRGERVTYTGHGWPHGYSYDWETLTGVDSIVAGRRPKVFIAYGSHAAFPVACAEDCTQLDFRVHVPDVIGVMLLLAAGIALVTCRSRWITGAAAVAGVVVIALPGLRVPDGRHDGTQPWAGNRDARCRALDCLVELPELREGTPISWNAFAGEWGKAECTTFEGFCVRSAGPTGPAAKCADDSECRYRRPDLHTPGSPAELTRRP